MAWFEARGLTKEYTLGDRRTVALDDVSLSAEKGDFVSIVGRSGSGKTTFLRLVSGLVEKTSGEIVYADGNRAHIGMVFQEPRLMPWLSVEQNILFAFLNGKSQDMPREKAARLLTLLGLSEYKDAYPHQLSGGMAQRVALGRALCYEPELILMDEPFGALDYFTRRALQAEILKLYFAEKKTIFFVTHDVEEALMLSRRIVVLENGRLLRDIAVDLPYPRKHADPRFAALLDEILALITG